MVAKKKPSVRKSPRNPAVIKHSLAWRLANWPRQFGDRLALRYRRFMKRRPHRTLRRTYRRDYVRSLKMTGYIKFTLEVCRTLLIRRNTFLMLVGLYVVLLFVLGSITSQETYTQISDLLKQSNSGALDGVLGQAGQAGILLLSTFAGGSSNISTEQQIVLVYALLLMWLSTVWLLREYTNGRRPRLRDGLYSSAAPTIPTMLVALVSVAQLFPVGVAALVFTALNAADLLSSGFGMMLYWLFAASCGALSLYWLTSTLIGLVVVTLPGMYPIQALRASSDLVLGRRLRVLYRLLWGALVVVLVWLLVMLPAVMIESYARGAWSWVASIPLIPLLAATMSAGSVIWYAAYVYLFYRKVVDDDSKPA